ncbi:hypothetical protein NC652_041249 [Populus alba x Populus x berolinensis]|uniref:Uncharacterized protein n=1 Tax=Populus tomentosa TaxID=118781 RepID=A0A8X7XUX0_POPTO|nr:hypothetical protein POTOM_058264 [Populus tomentosa]KAJ6858892.1 hypothetical protein NC652_041249 [Populus alba x Populus x berolinensis]
MEEDGCPPNEWSYNVIIRGFLRHRDESRAVQLIRMRILKTEQISGWWRMDFFKVKGLRKTHKPDPEKDLEDKPWPQPEESRN